MTALCVLGGKAAPYLENMIWGYSTECLPDTDRLCALVDIERREALRGKYGVECLSEDVEKCLESEMARLSSKKDCPPTFTSDSSRYLRWLYDHQGCVILSHYEKWCNRILCDLEIAVKVYRREDCDVALSPFLTSLNCDIGLDQINIVYNALCKLDVSTVIKESGCTVGAEVFIVQEFCDVGAGLTLNEEQCEIAHKVFLEKCSCDISLKEFISATSKWNNCFI